jgi:hypothetical protein
MSAIRNNSSRSEARRKRSTPYARGLVRFSNRHQQPFHPHRCLQIGTISRLFSYITGTPSEPSAEADGEDNNGRVSF